MKKKEDLISARKIFRTFRFIDDLITINNENFEKNIRNIYPAELEPKKENQINKSTNILDFNKHWGTKFQISNKTLR